MWCHARYLSGELAGGEAFATREQAEHRVARTLHIVFAFYQYYWLLFSFLFAILLNCSLPNLWVFAFFLLILLPVPPGRGKEWESNCVVLYCKLRQKHNNNWKIIPRVGDQVLEQGLSKASPKKPDLTLALPEMVGWTRWPPQVLSNQLTSFSDLYECAHVD